MKSYKLNILLLILAVSSYLFSNSIILTSSSKESVEINPEGKRNTSRGKGISSRREISLEGNTEEKGELLEGK